MNSIQQPNPLQESTGHILGFALAACADGECAGTIAQWPALSMALEDFDRAFSPETPVESLRGLCAEILRTFKS